MASKMDAVCLALTALWKAAPALAAVTVYDGPQVTGETPTDYLYVGYDGDLSNDDSEGSSAEQDWMAFAKLKQERGEIVCAAIANSGDVDVPAVRARAADIVSKAEDALRVDPLLGGLVMQSWLSDQRFIPVIDSNGSVARVVFTVSYVAQL